MEQLDIEDATKGNFVPLIKSTGSSGMPMPDHISARAEDLITLLSGLIETYELLCKDDFAAVL